MALILRRDRLVGCIFSLWGSSLIPSMTLIDSLISPFELYLILYMAYLPKVFPTYIVLKSLCHLSHHMSIIGKNNIILKITVQNSSHDGLESKKTCCSYTTIRKSSPK